MLVQPSSLARKVFEHVGMDLCLGDMQQRDIAYMERIFEGQFDQDGNPLPLSKELLTDSLNKLSYPTPKAQGGMTMASLLQ